MLLPLLFSQCVCLPVRCVWSDSAVLYYICHPSFHLSQVLPWLLQTHCCLFFEKDPGKRRRVGVINSNTMARTCLHALFFFFLYVSCNGSCKDAETWGKTLGWQLLCRALGERWCKLCSVCWLIYLSTADSQKKDQIKASSIPLMYHRPPFCPKKWLWTHQWVTPWHCVTCSFIITQIL